MIGERDKDNKGEQDRDGEDSNGRDQRSATPTNTKIGGYIAGGSLAVFVLAAVICGATGLAGAASRPNGLLEPAPVSDTDDPAEHAGPTLRALPQQEMGQIITLNVWRNDWDRTPERLEEVAEAWGGHRMRDSSRSYHQFAVPASTTEWLMELDVENGKNAYQALNEPPEATAGPDNPLTRVQVEINEQLVARKVYGRILWTSGALAGAAFIMSIIGVGIAIPPETFDN